MLNVFTKPGDKVIIQSPVYHPFHLVPEGNQLKVVNNPLRMNPDGRYEMDFEQLEECYDEQCKVFILCNPHNPGGRCWDHATLKRLADFCYSHHMVVISDEIHCDMAIFGNKHIPFAHVSQEAAEISITFGAPSKTFNIAGLVSSYAIVPNEQLRKKFFGWLDGNTISEGNIFSPIATMAAYEQGETWRRQMLAYVEENILAVEAFCERYMPQIRPIRSEASFLIWLDCRALCLDHDQLQQLFVDKARLALNDGEMFGPGGEGFMRMNVGSPRAYILQCLEQLKIISVPFIYLADNCSREAHRLGAPLFVCVWLDSLTNIKKKSNACKRKALSVAREIRMSLMSSRERRPFLSRAHTRTLTSVDLYAHDKKR